MSHFDRRTSKIPFLLGIILHWQQRHQHGSECPLWGLRVTGKGHWADRKRTRRSHPEENAYNKRQISVLKGVAVAGRESHQPRTVLEFLLRQQDRTYEEVAEEFVKVARRLDERGVA